MKSSIFFIAAALVPFVASKALYGEDCCREIFLESYGDIAFKLRPIELYFDEEQGLYVDWRDLTKMDYNTTAQVSLLP